MTTPNNPNTQYIWVWGTVPHSLSRVSYPTPLMNGGTLPANSSFSINISTSDVGDEKSFPFHPSICQTHTRPVLADICQIGAIRSVHASSNNVVLLNTNGSAFTWGSGVSIYDWPLCNRNIDITSQKPSGRVARELIAESVEQHNPCSSFGNFLPCSRVFHKLRDFVGNSQNMLGQTDSGRVQAWKQTQEDDPLELQRDLSNDEDVYSPLDDNSHLMEQPPFLPVVQRGTESHDGSKGAVPIQPSAFSEQIVYASVGTHHGLATGASGRVLGWGSASHGKLGETSQWNWPFPKYIASLQPYHVLWACASHSHSLFCTREGSLYALGCGLHGKQGNGAVFDTNTPVQVVLPSQCKVTEATCGYAHSICKDDQGQQYAWGSNDQGQQGLGDVQTRQIPTKIQFSEDQVYIVKVVSGPFHNVACTSIGTIYVWGNNSYHQLALDVLNASIPTLIPDFESLDVHHIATTAKYTVCVTRNNQLPILDLDASGRIDQTSSQNGMYNNLNNGSMSGQSLDSEGLASLPHKMVYHDILDQDAESLSDTASIVDDTVNQMNSSTPIRASNTNSEEEDLTPRQSQIFRDSLKLEDTPISSSPNSVTQTNSYTPSSTTKAVKSHQKPPRPSTMYTYDSSTYGEADQRAVSGDCKLLHVHNHKKALLRGILASLTDPNDPEPFYELVEPDEEPQIADIDLDTSSLCEYDTKNPIKIVNTPLKAPATQPITSGGSLGSQELKVVTSRYNEKLTKDAVLRSQQQQQHVKNSKQQGLNASKQLRDMKLKEERGEFTEKMILTKILEYFIPFIDLSSIDNPKQTQADITVSEFLSQKPWTNSVSGIMSFFGKRKQNVNFVKFPISNEAWVDVCEDPRTNPVVWSRQCRLVVEDGVPSRLRKYLWPLVVANTQNVTHDEYLALKAKATVVRRQYNSRTCENAHKEIVTAYVEQFCSGIDVDLSRTFPHLAFYQQGSEQKTNMQQLLDSFCLAYPQIGYVQGLSYLCGKLLLVLDEYHTFRCLGNITHMRFALAAYKLDAHQLQLRYNLFLQVFKETSPGLYKHLESIDILECGQSLFFLDWLLTIFCKRLDLDLSARVWDIFLVYGEPTIYRVGVALFLCLKDMLMDKSFEEVHTVLNNMKCMRAIQEATLLQHYKTVNWTPQHDAEQTRISSLPISDWDNK